ncbi:MAG: protein-disulfide reductase DsbD domain-containing protein [Pseudomonadota bacterium]
MGVAFALAVGSVVVPSPAPAQQLVSTGGSFLQATLLPGGRMADGRQSAALVLEVKPGWKTYWRQPGEAGVPPEFDWSGSQNLDALEIAWPAPTPFESFGYMTLGYGGRVVLPLALTPVDHGRPVELGLDARFGVCREICVFEEVALNETVWPDATSIHDGVIAAAQGMLPGGPSETGARVLECRLAGAGAERALEARLSLPETASEPVVVVEGPAGAWVGAQSTEVEGGEIALNATVMLPEGTAWVDRSDIRFTLLGEGLGATAAAELNGCRPTES